MPILLILHFSGNQKRLKSANKILTKIAYFPISILIYIIFIGSTVILIPFAYVKGILLCYVAKKNKVLASLLITFFVIFGIPILIYTML